MRRYSRLHSRALGLLLFSLVGVSVTLPLAAQAPATPPDPCSLKVDPVARAGFEAYYTLDYDKAVRDFERDLAAHPDDPYALNHMLSAVLFRELYRAGALDTSLYSNNNFLTKKTFPIDAKAKAQINQLTDRALRASEARLKANPQDVNALYAHGATLSLRATYIGLVDKAWYSALRSALGARHDHEKVLQLDPSFADAKTVIGVHQYVVGALPWPVKIAASMVGVSGNKQKGLEYLKEAAESAEETGQDAAVARSLFLRREQRYDEALATIRSLLAKHPKNFLFLLEEANLLNAAGHGGDAISAYRRILQEGKDGAFPDPHLELAAFALGDALRGQREYAAAAEAFDSVASYPHRDPELLQRANLAAGQMYDLLGRRDAATSKYNAVLSANAESPEAESARRYLKQPFRNP